MGRVLFLMGWGMNGLSGVYRAVACPRVTPRTRRTAVLPDSDPQAEQRCMCSVLHRCDEPLEAGAFSAVLVNDPFLAFGSDAFQHVQGPFET